MISNAATFKLKALKSSRDLDEDVIADEDASEHRSSSSTEIIGDTNHVRIQINNRSNNDSRHLKTGASSKPRQFEYRSTRGAGNERRGRGRGTSRPRDRDDGSSYLSSRKFQESLNKNSTDSATSLHYHSKYYDVHADKKAAADLSYGLPEDTRISKLLRRLNQETDQEKSLGISKKLLEVLLIPDNGRYVRRAFHILSASVLEILHVAPGPAAKKRVACALGRIGNIMESDFRKFQEWLFQKFTAENDEIKVLFMVAIGETLKFEKMAPKLQDFSEALMGELQMSIELTENPDVFTATLENLIELIEIYPEDFYSQFSNTVDILFGWHVDHTQPMSVIEFVSKSLQRLSKHFQIHLEFSVTLIKHFLEDMDDYIKQLHKRKSGSGKEHVLEGDLEPIIMSILAVNTVLKCLGNGFSPANSETVSYPFVTECLSQIVRTATDSLENYVPDNLIIAANDSVSLFLAVLGTKTGQVSEAVYSLIDLELSLTQEFSDATIVSMLLMISKVIKELSANLPIELVQKLVGPSSELLKLRNSNVNSIQNAVVVVYQSLLNLKNIPLLQEAYRCVLGDLEFVYRNIVPDMDVLCQNNPFDECKCQEDEAEATALFLLRCLSLLANASSSIIGMWALKPSILELLANNLKPFDANLCRSAPSLQYGLIYLLYSHCKCYNHFVSSSSLVTTNVNVIGRLSGVAGMDDVAKSPSSGNLAVILSVLSKCLNARTTCETELLLLQWFEDVLLHSETYMETLYTSDEFTQMANALFSAGFLCNKKIVLSVCVNLEKLLSNKQLSWSNAFLTSVCDLCKLHMNSNDPEIRKAYVNLSVNIPWDICVIDMIRMYTVQEANRKCTDISGYSNWSVVLAQSLQLNGTVFGEILPQQFKILMNYLLNNEEPNESNWLMNVFTCCWPLDSEPQANSENFRELALSSRTVLYSWAAWESAQLCVNSKLRTPLGKPIETFTSFEIALKDLLKNVSRTDEAESGNRVVKQERVRLLLDFMECLEKSIYNASEGCAFAMQPPLKPVKTFFHTNTSTCQEWLNRIRTMVIHLALHSGYSTLALRHGQAFLQHLANANKTKSPEFDKVLMLVSLAMLNLKEAEALQGLYVWSQKVAGKSVAWIKCVVDQASKKYENAAEKYESMLQSAADEIEPKENASTIDVTIKHFMSDQIVNCYKNLNNWKAAVSWKEREKEYLQTEGENGGKYFYTSVDAKTANVLAEIEASNYVIMNDLMNWDDAKCNTTSWSAYQISKNIEKNLYNISLNIASNQCNPSEEIDNTLNDIQRTIQDNLRSLPSEFLQDYTVLHYAAYGLKNIINNTSAVPVFLVSEEFETEIKKMDSCLLSKILWWFEYFSKLQDEGSSIFFSNLRLDIIKKARKEGNLHLAYTHLHKYLQQKELMNGIVTPFKTNMCIDISPEHSSSGVTSMLENVAEGLINPINKYDISIWTYDNSRAVIEAAKLLYASRENKELVLNLCATASTGIMQHLELNASPELQQTSCKILLTLAKWIQAENNPEILTNSETSLGRLVMILPDIGLVENRGTSLIPLADMAVGKLLKVSLHQCATSGKAWSSFGAWCYRWGRKIVDNNSATGGQLVAEDRFAVQSLLPPETNAEDMKRVCDILSQTRATADEEDIELNEINTSEMIESQLLEVPVLMHAHPDQLTSLVDIWRNAQKRIYSYYELSAEAYFKYLHLASTFEAISSGAECTTISATLRLLRLIVKHALELQNVLETGLANTPTHPWKVIIPQLFSRLNHPEGYVRRRVSELLCRVAEDAPHLITFPAVVGAVDGGLGLKFELPEIAMSKDCFSQANEAEDPEIEEEFEAETDQSRDVLHSCFMSMVETLSKQAPETIAQVQLLVKELRRITLLWDELWLGTLLQHHGEISKRLVQLELEVEKVNANANLTAEEKSKLISEKHRIIIKPIVFILEQLHAMTSVEPETPHEKVFQERYLHSINDVLDKLRNPENPGKPQESWQPLKLLQSKLQQRAHKRASYTLKMKDISPILANMTDTVISMPGVTKSSKTLVTIASVSNHVSILPTKTKPKKLVFHGSDGDTYTYLFKGLEDLHLDERIMQFLSIANTMMAKNSDNTTHNLYRARHYSVIPLGPRSGLISWVDGTIPVFALYKRWQQREAAKSNGKLNSNPSVPRPSELFYNKLNPLLQEHGVKNKENRKEWPLACLKKVLVELIAETPSNLLEKEFWCHSINAGAWWQTVRNYSYSVAVMSIIGYIIGLGDRHLDNLLVDLSSGEVVHIDYNVCFEKGKTLRVPEKVPFRMTENLKAALGVTGVEGIFRMACENVLKTMKKGRETLLTLLEAFVYDPLVDWTLGGEGLAGTTFRGVAGGDVNKQSRKDLEHEVTLAMFNVRCAEMKADWNKNKTDILEEIYPLIEKLNQWLDEHNRIKELEDVLQDLHQHMALIKEAEAHGNQRHPLYKLPSRYLVYKKTKDLQKNAQQYLEDLVVECQRHLQLHSDALGAIQGPTYNEWFLKISAPIDKESLKVFELVKEFLQNAGQTSMVTQCEQSENDITLLLQQQLTCMQNCLAMLSQYGQLAALYPASYIEKHRTVCFLKWTKYLLEAKSINACEEVFLDFNSTYNLEVDSKLFQNVVDFNYQLQVMISGVMQRIKLNCERLTLLKSHAMSNGASLEKSYGDAKAGIVNFLRNEKGAVKAYEFVVINQLCSLNKQYLEMEKTARSAGNYLVTLTSRDGDWFLDEMLLMSSLISELVGSLPSYAYAKCEDQAIGQTIAGLKIANNIYKGLQELNYNFHTVILPEAMSRVQCEDESVTHMIAQLEELLDKIGLPLDEIIVQLEKQLTRVVLKMDEDHPQDQVIDLVSCIRQQYEAMLHSQSDSLSPGQMLLMGFNGLFENLNRETSSLVHTLGNLGTATCWRKVDQVQDAKALAAPIYDPKARAVLDDIFLLKRLQTMSEFFALCTETGVSFKGTSAATVYTDEQLSKPIKTFTADYISRQFLGIKTEAIAYLQCLLMQHLGLNVTNEIEQKDIGAENKVPLEDLCKKAMDYNLKRGFFTSNVLAQASSLCGNMRNAWRKFEIPKYIDDKIKMQNSTITRLQSQLTAHSWLHESILARSANLLNSSTFKRSNFLLEMRSVASALLAMQPRLQEAREHQKNLVTSVEQRLKWASGANPDLLEVMAAFESIIANRERQLDADLKLANVIAGTCNALVQHEAIRTQSVEANHFSQRFLEKLEMWREACAICENCPETLTDAEENLMQLMPCDPHSDINWVQKLSGRISEAIAEQQVKVTEEKGINYVTNDGLITAAGKVKALLGKHQKLMADVKTLLKAMAKLDDCQEKVQAYLQKHKQFFEHLAPVVNLTKEDVNQENVEDVLESLKIVQTDIGEVFEELLNLDGEKGGGCYGNGNGRPPLVRQDGVASPKKSSPKHEAGKGQQRNAYAVGVWRRVRLKLEGRDPDPGRKYTLQEQVDYVIKEAVNVENLALLYEGWTPWV